MYKLRTLAVAGLLSCLSASALTGTGDSPIGMLDSTPPEVSDLQVDYSNASPGDTITITFQVSESLMEPPNVSVNGAPAAFLNQAGGFYTYTYVVSIFDSSGPATVSVAIADAIGNAGASTNTAMLDLEVPPLPLRWPAIAVLAVVIAALVMRRRRRAAATLLVAVVCLNTVAQIPEVSNVAFTQQAGANGTEVIITYDLVSPVSACDITIRLSKDAGVDGFIHPADSISGDVVNVFSGTGKTIVWDLTADYPNEEIPQAQLRLYAATRPQDCFGWEEAYPIHRYPNLAECQNQLKRVGLTNASFADDNSGWFPRLSNQSGRLMVRADDVTPGCLLDPEVLICPGPQPHANPAAYDDTYYVYLGYLLANDDDVLAFTNAYAAVINDGGDFSANLPVTSSYGSELARLKEGVQFLLPTDGNDPNGHQRASQIPVMFDWPDNHQSAWGGNVLYLDGHVEFRHYPDEFPMTETTINALAAIAGYAPPTQWNQPDPNLPYSPQNDPGHFASACWGNFARLSISLDMFMNDALNERLPRLSNLEGRLMMRDDEMYPEYIDQPHWVLCPGTTPTTPAPFFDDKDYMYLGYLAATDNDVDAFAAAYAAEIAEGGDFSSSLPFATSYADSLLRLERGIERFLITDINNPACMSAADVPVLIEWPDNHEGLAGGHVLYLDGHREWLPYPGPFPMTTHTIETLATIAGRAPDTNWAPVNPPPPAASDLYHQVLCAHNMEYLGLALRTFPIVHDDRLPDLSTTSDTLIFDTTEILPHHLNDLTRLNCPGSSYACLSPSADNHSYVYLGYVVLNDADVAEFATIHAAQLAANGDFSEDLPGSMSYGGTAYHLHVGVERTISDESPLELSEGEIPILIEWPDNHSDLRGGNVLFMDGHTEWMEYPGEFPMTEATMNILTSLAGRSPIE